MFGRCHHHSWFPFILIGLTFGLALAVVVTQYDQPARFAAQIFAPSVEDYQAHVNTVLMDYELNGDTEAAYQGLLDTRVPAELKSRHLQLVLLFGQALADSRQVEQSEWQSVLDMY